jgi:hypothetical protein
MLDWKKQNKKKNKKSKTQQREIRIIELRQT